MDTHYTVNKIAALRKKKGWTQKDIAEKLNVSIAAVSKWERGLNYPDLSIMEPLARILDISVAELLGLENESTDLVIHNLSEISMTEREESVKRLWSGVGFVIFTFALFFILAWAIHVFGSDNQNMRLLFQYDRTGIFNIMALLLGIAAWVLSVMGIFSRTEKRQTACSILSFLCCAAALFFPTLITDLIMRFENYGTVEDTIWAYHFACSVLLLGTILFNGCAWLIHRK